MARPCIHTRKERMCTPAVLIDADPCKSLAEITLLWDRRRGRDSL
jgi:hypothetical protein